MSMINIPDVLEAPDGDSSNADATEALLYDAAWDATGIEATARDLVELGVWMAAREADRTRITLSSSPYLPLIVGAMPPP